MIEVGLGTSLSRSLIVSLAADCGTAAELARLVRGTGERAAGGRDVFRDSITFASRSALARVAADFDRRSWLTIIPVGWRVGPVVVPKNVMSFLEGAAAMRANDPDKETSIAVVTMPPQSDRIRLRQLKAHVRKSAARTINALERAFANALPQFKSDDGQSFCPRWVQPLAVC